MGTFKQNNDAPATSRILFSLVAKAWVVSINLFRSVSEPDMSSRSMRFPVSSASCKTSRCLGLRQEGEQSLETSFAPHLVPVIQTLNLICLIQKDFPIHFASHGNGTFYWARTMCKTTFSHAWASYGFFQEGGENSGLFQGWPKRFFFRVGPTVVKFHFTNSENKIKYFFY